jgi:phenylalanyl-tRNA synthetase alpha chain
LSPHEVARALAVRDLTDPAEGRHALQRLVTDATQVLVRAWRCELRVQRGPRAVPVADHELLADASGVTSPRPVGAVAPGMVLRAHTSACVPAVLRALAASSARGTDLDVLVACPGVVYRGDPVDRRHAPAPHQVNLWRVTSRPGSERELKEMAELVVRTLVPGAEHRLRAVAPGAEHAIEIENGDEWVEVGQCSPAPPRLMRACGLDASGLAMGLGLDRLLMLRKGLADIALVRSGDPRVSRQMLDLSLYRPPPARVRDDCGG